MADAQREALEAARDALNEICQTQVIFGDTVHKTYAAIAQIDAALAEPDAPQWQPIATAPTDGTCVQLWTGHYQHTAWYDGEIPVCWRTMADDVEIVPRPTHWMPLPDAPHVGMHDPQAAMLASGEKAAGGE